MAMTADRPSRWDVPQSPPSGPPHGSRGSGYVIAAIVVVVVVTAVVVGLVLSKHSKSTFGGTTPITAPRADTTATGMNTTIPTNATSTGPPGIPADQANPPSLAGAYFTDPIRVLRTLSAYSDWLFAHPNPALLANYMLPTCTQYNAVKAELTTLADNHWHARPSVTMIEWSRVDVPFTPAPGFLDGHPSFVGGGVKVVVGYSPQSSDVLNAAGQIVNSLHNPGILMAVINFAQGSDGQFRVISEASFNPPGGVAAFES
jgi:hypothetical protein